MKRQIRRDRITGSGALLAFAALTVSSQGALSQSLAPMPPVAPAPAGVFQGAVPGLAPPINSGYNAPGYNASPASGFNNSSSSAPKQNVTPGCDLSNLGANPKVIPGLPYDIPIPAAFQQAPKFNPDMWKAGRGGGGAGNFGSILTVGTVLTGILEDDIDSGKNKVGDVFSIRLEDGFQGSNGVDLIPKQSKIVGTIVNVAPAKSQRNGNPGKIDISLQSLVFPDGRSIPIWAYVDHNPNSKTVAASNPAKTAAGYGMRGASGIVSMVTGRLGYRMYVPRYGNDFEMDKGDILPIKLSRGLDLSKMQQVAPPQIASRPPGMYQPPRTFQPPKPVELSAGPMKSLADADNTTSFSGAPQTAIPPAAIPGGNMPSGNMMMGPQADPNAIFESPIPQPTSRSALNEMPDPF